MHTKVTSLSLEIYGTWLLLSHTCFWIMVLENIFSSIKKWRKIGSRYSEDSGYTLNTYNYVPGSNDRGSTLSFIFIEKIKSRIYFDG